MLVVRAVSLKLKLLANNVLCWYCVTKGRTEVRREGVGEGERGFWEGVVVMCD